MLKKKEAICTTTIFTAAAATTKRRDEIKMEKTEMVVNGSIKIDIEIDRPTDRCNRDFTYMKYARLHCTFEHHELSQTIYSLNQSSVRACVHTAHTAVVYVSDVLRSHRRLFIDE